MAEGTQKLTASDQDWDATRYEAALAHLERLQEQLDGLRSTIPSIIAPMLKAGQSRPQMFAEIKRSVMQSTGDLKAFRDNWTSEQTQQLLSRSRQSLQKDGDLSKANSVPHYGWSTVS